LKLPEDWKNIPLKAFTSPDRLACAESGAVPPIPPHHTASAIQNKSLHFMENRLLVGIDFISLPFFA
jgi:hypothetical protein